MLLLPPLLAPQAAFVVAAATAALDDTSLGLHSERCQAPGSDAAPASNLLQIAAKTGGPADTFGPDKCVALKRSTEGTCVLQTRCKGNNISKTEFAFVCFNPGAAMPHALHSFGRGGFSLQETFDTKVSCKTCISVDTAFQTGDSVVRNALAALPLSRLPSLSGAVQGAGVYSVQQLSEFKPKEAAVFGPDFCISTFRAPAGTCLIRTRCADADLTKFNVGVTCLDQSGGYTRYLFGKDSFKPEETFDTLVTCEKCLGVGPEASQFALHGLMPRKLVDDVNTLKFDMQTMKEKVRVLRENAQGRRRKKKKEKAKGEKEEDEAPGSQLWTMPESTSDVKKSESPMSTPSGASSISSAVRKRRARRVETNSREAVAKPELSEEASIPTIRMSRRQRRTGDYEVSGADVAQERPRHHTTSSELQEAGAETAAVDAGDTKMQIVTHRRGNNAIAELLKRVNVSERSGAADELALPRSSSRWRAEERSQ